MDTITPPISPTIRNNTTVKSLWNQYGLHIHDNNNNNNNKTTSFTSTQQLSSSNTNNTTHHNFTSIQYTIHREQLKKVFTVFSTDNGSSIHINDIGTILRCMNQYINNNELNNYIVPTLKQKQLIANNSSNNNNNATTTTTIDDITHITYDIYESVILHIIVDNMYELHNIQTELLHSFELLDTQNNNFLTRQQFIDTIKQYDSINNITDEQLNSFIDCICDNDTQLIYYKDYVQAILETV